MSSPIGDSRGNVNQQPFEAKNKKRERDDESSLDLRIAQLKGNVETMEYLRSSNPATFKLAELQTVGIDMADVLANMKKIDRAASPQNEELFQRMDGVLKDLGIVLPPVSSKEDNLKRAKIAMDQESGSDLEVTLADDILPYWPDILEEQEDVDATPLPSSLVPYPEETKHRADETKLTAQTFQLKAAEAKLRDNEIHGLVEELEESEEELKGMSNKMRAVTYGSEENQATVMNELKSSLSKVLTDLSRLAEVISALPRDVRVMAKYSNQLEKSTGDILVHFHMLKHSLKIFDDMHSFADESINKSIKSVEEAFKKVDKDADIFAEAPPSPQTSGVSSTVSSPTTTPESKSSIEDLSLASLVASPAQEEKDHEMKKILANLKDLMRQSSLMLANKKHLFDSTDASIEVRNYLNRIIEVDRKFEGLQDLYPNNETEYDAEIDKITDDLQPILIAMKKRLQAFRAAGQPREDLEALIKTIKNLE